MTTCICPRLRTKRHYRHVCRRPPSRSRLDVLDAAVLRAQTAAPDLMTRCRVDRALERLRRYLDAPGPPAPER